MEKNLIFEQISQSCKTQEYIEMYAYTNVDNEFAVGQVIAYTSEDILIHAINSMGVDDGFFIGRIKDICRISTGSNYLRSILKLSESQILKPTNIKGLCKDMNLFENYLEHFKYTKAIITIHTYQQETFHGFIIDCASDTVKIKMLTDNCTLNGETTMYIYDIETLSFESSEEIRLRKLENKK